MGLALIEAERAGRAGDKAVGCTYVTQFNDVVSTETREFRDQNLESHAEKRGYNLIQPIVGRDLSGCKLYTTTEPCFGCSYTLDKGSIGMLFLAVFKAEVPDHFRNPDTLHTIWKKSRRTLRVVSGLQRVRAMEIIGKYPLKH
jgi:tRNA(Arg) A34 adenosine deaminase TadA